VERNVNYLLTFHGYRRGMTIRCTNKRHRKRIGEKGGQEIHRVSQEERSIFWEAIVSIILSKKKCIMYMCPISNCF
jgi:hypothetical protein